MPGTVIGQASRGALLVGLGLLTLSAVPEPVAPPAGLAQLLSGDGRCGGPRARSGPGWEIGRASCRERV